MCISGVYQFYSIAMNQVSRHLPDYIFGSSIANMRQIKLCQEL
jgi:hypothetical protein